MTKSNRPMVRIHNTETDEIIDREMNDQEFSDWQAQQAENAKQEAEAQVKAEAKTALLAKLGITQEEATLLLQ